MKLTVKKNYDGYSHSVENAILLWIGVRIYPYVNSDFMSYLALASAFGIGLSAYLAGIDIRFLWFVIPGIILHGIGDGLDGKIAKLRHKQRPKYGYYMDRIFDSTSFTMSFVGMHISKLTHTDAWMFVLAFTMLHMAHIFLKTSVTSIFDMQIGKFGGGEIKLAVVGIVLIMIVTGNPTIGTGTIFSSWTLADAIGWATALLLGIAYVGSITRALYGPKKIHE